MSIERDAFKIAVRLRSSLHKVSVGDGFSGIGVIIWDGGSAIPIMPMRAASAFDTPREIWHLLAELADENCPLHDGFHVLDENLDLLIPSVYFSPPIVVGLGLPSEPAEFGGRYLAAMYGSCLKGVVCTGVLSRKYGVRVFCEGREL